jgi:hypothetical protein
MSRRVVDRTCGRFLDHMRSDRVFRAGFSFLVMGVVWPVVGVASLFAPGPVWWRVAVFVVAAGSSLWLVLLVPWSFRISSGVLMLRYFPFGLYGSIVPREGTTVFLARRARADLPGLRIPLRVEVVRAVPILRLGPLGIRTAYLSGRPSLPHFDRGGDEIVELLRMEGFEVRDGSPVSRQAG